MSTSKEAFQYTLLATTSKGSLKLMHVTAVGIDDVWGYASHVRQFPQHLVFPGFINPIGDDGEVQSPESGHVEVVDLTGPLEAWPR